MLQVLIRGFMILNEAEEQRKVANSAPLTEVLRTALIGSTAPAAMPAAASETVSPGGKLASLSEVLVPGSLSQADRKAARVAGSAATAVTEMAEKPLPRLQGSAEGGSAASATELSLAALAPASAGLQTAVAAGAQEQ